MSVYGNFLKNETTTLQENSIVNFDFDMYDFISEETTILRNMLVECVDDKALLENQLMLLEAFDIKVFIKNLLVKLKEFIKKVFAKFQQISTQFVNKQYIDFWKNRKIDEEILSKQMYYASKQYLNGSDKSGFYIDFFNMKSDANLQKILNIIEDEKIDNWDDVSREIMHQFFTASENSFVEVSDSYEEFKNKNSKAVSFAISNKNNIIKVLKGDYIYEAKKKIIKLQSEAERLINNLSSSTDSDSKDFSEQKDRMSNICKGVVKIVKEHSEYVLGDFRFYLKLTSLCLKAEGDNYEPGDGKYTDDEKVGNTIKKVQNSFDK